MAKLQLTIIEGHNGAGKTTLISMLTGSLDPTSGDAEFYGNSLTKDLSALKKIVGICPQYDAIWPQLTVYEHLQLFAGFKGNIAYIPPQCYGG
jgi:ATP-binding cassette subfamily A (ABC1) protein 3